MPERRDDTQREEPHDARADGDQVPQGGRSSMEQAQPNEGARQGHDEDETQEQPPRAGIGGYGPVDATQPEPGPDPTVGGTDLPGQAQADLTGEEQEVRTENQPPPQGMQVPRESHTPSATLHDAIEETDEERGGKGGHQAA